MRKLSLFNTLHLLPILLLINLFTCCDGCFFDEYDKPENIVMTGIDGSRNIEVNLKQIAANNHPQPFLFPIKFSPRGEETVLTEGDFKSVKCKFNNAKNVAKIMYASTPTQYDTISGGDINLHKLLSIHGLSTGKLIDKNGINTIIALIPLDKTKPCSLKVELEVNGKIIDGEFVNVTGKLNDSGSGDAPKDAPKVEVEFLPGKDELEQDHYKILGIPRNATPKEIRTAYLRLVLENHPDKNPRDVDNAKEKFQAIKLANEILSDPKLRSAWHKARKHHGRE